MVADPEIGLVNLESKEVLHEYHVYPNKEEEVIKYNISWGAKLLQTQDALYLSLAESLVMPYSLQSVVQSLQDEVYDSAIVFLFWVSATNNFYIEDYYKVNGATQLHKLA